ncbi:MAG: hypothetical protein ACUZ8H_10375 [Candidatus Anammoxibacter sp.]
MTILSYSEPKAVAEQESRLLDMKLEAMRLEIKADMLLTIIQIGEKAIKRLRD